MKGRSKATKGATNLRLHQSDRLLEVTHIFGMLCLISSPVWAIMLLFPNGAFPPGTGMLTFPGLIALQLFIISRVAKRDGFLKEVMLVGMAIRFISTALFLWLFFGVWHGAADLVGYYDKATQISTEFYRTGRLIFFLPFKIEKVVTDLAGVIAIATGASLSGLCLIFGFFAFIGQVLFFKGFCLAFPKINTRMPAMVFFMLPSMLFWTSFLSKDSLIFLLIGISFYGFMRMQKSGLWWLPFALFGLIGAGLIRPHIGGMLSIAYVGTFLLTTERKGYSVIAAKFLLGPLLLVGTGYLVANGRNMIQGETINENVQSMQTLHKGLQTGGSSTGSASVGMGLLLAPVLPFRPLPWEVHNAQMAVSCIESSLLFLAFWRRRKGILLAFKSVRKSPALVASAIFCAQFMVVFSISMGNIGTLVRERAMMLPFWFIIVFSVEPEKKTAQSYAAVRRLRALREIALNS
jgi:hypothetical protein